LVAIEPKDPANLEFFDEAKNHLESKYLDVLNAWEELKGATLEHNKEIATFLEEIRTLIVKEVAMPCYYWGMRGDEPERYVRPARLALHIYEIISHEIRTGRQWFGGKPKVRPTIYGDTTFYELQWGNDSRLVKSQEKKLRNTCLSLYNLLSLRTIEAKRKISLKKSQRFLDQNA